jgi:hypothetical protein
MSAYNAERFIETAIESILGQTFRDFEFLILNDGSTDGTSAILDRYRGGDSRIRIIERENRGLVASLNELIKEAEAPILARMDADDVALPERFERQMAFLEAHPEFGVVGACADRIDDQGERYHGPRLDCPDTHEGFIETVGRGPLLVHTSVMYRKAVVLEAGGYHPAFRHCEDLDLWLRLSSRTKICSLPEILVLYRTSDGQVSSTHVIEQNVNAAIAIHAWRLRTSGAADPTSEIAALPRLERVDELFGELGLEKRFLATIVPHLLHSKPALSSEGISLVERHIAYGNDRKGLWRTVARLMLLFGEWKSGLRLATALIARPSPTHG